MYVEKYDNSSIKIQLEAYPNHSRITSFEFVSFNENCLQNILDRSISNIRCNLNNM